MKKIITTSVVLLSCTLVLLQSCTKSSQGDFNASGSVLTDQVIKATVAPGQSYVLSFGYSGSVSITSQASHYQISETGADDKDGSLIYKYIPAVDYLGVDEVLLTYKTETSSGSNSGCSNGSNNNTSKSTSIKVKINVTN
jgi:hypothetical protein